MKRSPLYYFVRGVCRFLVQIGIAIGVLFSAYWFILLFWATFYP
jgi:hypothetical protein